MTNNGYITVKEAIEELSKLDDDYIVELDIIGKGYDPNYGDDKLCECGHPYYRHFDTYEGMIPVGCKYCQCYSFKEVKQGVVL